MRPPSAIALYLRLGLTPIPLKPRSKEPLVRWHNGWNPTPVDLQRWATKPSINWGVRCGTELAALDFDSEGTFRSFLAGHPEAAWWPRVKTGRGYHLWVRPKGAIPTRHLNGLEIKCLGSYVVAPPSVHPSGLPYIFEVAPNGVLPKVDLEELLGLGEIDSSETLGSHESTRDTAPSAFALRYGKSPWPRSMCGLATKVLTRSDGKVKHLVSMRDWKWDCPKCAPLLKRHWLAKLKRMSFRFILRLPTWDKPSRFLRRLGNPRYVHAVANGEGWLFLLDGETQLVWLNARNAGYALVAGDVASDPTSENIEECLDKALCREEEPLTTRRKITHSKGLLKKAAQGDESDESKQPGDCGEGGDDMKAAFGKEPLTWESEVVMKPIEQVASELEGQGWRILWQSEVEALAIKEKTPEAQDMDIVELLDTIGVKLKKVGKEYKGLCPFHNDHEPSFSVNKEKGVWHCFGCGKGGDAHKFIVEWEALKR